MLTLIRLIAHELLLFWELRHWSRVATSYDGSGGEPDEMRLQLVPWFLRSFPGSLRGGTNSEMHRRGRKRDLFRCTLSAYGKEGSRRHPGQFECRGPQFHQSTKRPPFCAGGSRAGLFCAACPAPTRTGTIHSRSFGKARGSPRVTSADRMRCRAKAVCDEPNATVAQALRRL